MFNNKFAIGTWEIHLQTEEEQNYIQSKLSSVCEYIDTAIDYNNDYLLSHVNNYKIISKISSYHLNKYEFFVSNHMKCLNRDKIDIMLIHSNRGNWQGLVNLMQNDNRFIEIGVSNFNVDELKEYKSIAGVYPSYNEIEINPLYTDLDTINFCKENNIKIISYGIFTGKYTAMLNISRYSLPYMLSYAAKVADIVIIKPECFRHTNEIYDVITNYVPNFDNIEIKNIIKEDDKSIVPMRYDASIIYPKTCINFPTYHIACGNNSTDVEWISTKLEIDESFEMLGDYMTYIRYKFRQQYSGKPVYYYDFLIGDDGSYYVVYLYDENNNVSKVNKYNKVSILNIHKNIFD